MSRSEFSRRIGYEFRRPELLEAALTHSSFINEGRGESGESDNERLEFLGDAIFDAVISDHLYQGESRTGEGGLTRMRAAIVCERSLARCGLELGLGEFLRLGKGEESSGGRHRHSIIADATEAVIAAIYLDGGWEAARRFILEAFSGIIQETQAGRGYSDYKTELQERLQIGGNVAIKYQVEKEEGPDHNKTFYVGLWADGRRLSQGSGRSKKEAEQDAARNALMK